MGISGLGFLGFRGLRSSVSGLRVWGFGFRGFGFKGLGFRILRAGRFGLRLRFGGVYGAGFRVRASVPELKPPILKNQKHP